MVHGEEDLRRRDRRKNDRREKATVVVGGVLGIGGDN